MTRQSSSSAIRFAAIGVAGFVAQRHLTAIKAVGGHLHAAMDPNDAVGSMDKHFPDARFYTEFERFDRYIDKLGREGQGVQYVSICSPNYLHDSHVGFALRAGADAICEKPLVLDPGSIDFLEKLELDTDHKAYTILQLRLHPAIIALREKIASGPPGHVYDVDLTYITSRGRWYYVSWKGDEAKSGGIATNIGVHFFDMLSHVFGAVKTNIVHHRAIDCAAGYIEYEQARVRWFLSINAHDVPPAVRVRQTTFRSITVDGDELEFSDGFTDLHTDSYREIMAGRGFRVKEARPSIETVAAIRTAPLTPADGEAHPLLAEATTGERYSGGWPV